MGLSAAESRSVLCMHDTEGEFVAITAMCAVAVWIVMRVKPTEGELQASR